VRPHQPKSTAPREGRGAAGLAYAEIDDPGLNLASVSGRIAGTSLAYRRLVLQGMCVSGGMRRWAARPPSTLIDRKLFTEGRRENTGGSKNEIGVVHLE